MKCQIKQVLLSRIVGASLSAVLLFRIDYKPTLTWSPLAGLAAGNSQYLGEWPFAVVTIGPNALVYGAFDFRL